ncbi:hypothetical protein MRX96_053797 [Rhipicephalus microplus]
MFRTRALYVYTRVPHVALGCFNGRVSIAWQRGEGNMHRGEQWCNAGGPLLPVIWHDKAQSIRLQGTADVARVALAWGLPQKPDASAGPSAAWY